MHVPGPLLDIQPNGHRPPFFLVHPAGGTVFFAHRFARLLPPDQPLFGLQAVGLDGRESPLDSIEAMVDRYLPAIRARQPRGPYFLGGPSFGGYVAYAIACRLRSEGEPVGMVALFDAYGPNYPRSLALPGRLFDHLRFLFGNPRHYLRRLLARVRARLRGLSSDIGYEPIPEELAPELSSYADPIRQVVRANDRAAVTFRPAKYPGRVHLFRATLTPEDWIGRRFDDETNGWRTVAEGGVEVIPIAGTHQFIFDEPAVLDLAPKFAKALGEAQIAVARDVES